MDSLTMFSAGSFNDNTHKHLWIKGASLFISQINSLININNKEYTFKYKNINEFPIDNETVELGSILDTFGSDKACSHSYHIVYADIIKKLGRNSKLKLLEIGMGTNNPTIVSCMGPNGRPGASLFAFQTYLPNSEIYGADIDTNILFNYDRIKTHYVDQLNMQTFVEMNRNFGNLTYDIIIDDGLHSIAANLNTLLFALEHLNPNGWLIVEDIHIIDNWKSIDFILGSNKNYEAYMINIKGCGLYIVHKLADGIQQ